MIQIQFLDYNSTNVTFMLRMPSFLFQHKALTIFPPFVPRGFVPKGPLVKNRHWFLGWNSFKRFNAFLSHWIDFLFRMTSYSAIMTRAPARTSWDTHERLWSGTVRRWWAYSLASDCCCWWPVRCFSWQHPASSAASVACATPTAGRPSTETKLMEWTLSLKKWRAMRCRKSFPSWIKQPT